MLELVQKCTDKQDVIPIVNAAVAGFHTRNNIVSLLDCVRKDDRTSLIFEFVEGRDFITDLPSLTELRVARYMRELLISLSHVHRCPACDCGPHFARESAMYRLKLVHRDIKPSNFMCTAHLVS